MEKKQFVLIVVLVIAIAGVSFSLGVMYGRKGGAVMPGFSGGSNKPKLPMVTKVAPPPKPEPQVVEEKMEKLTFYDNLPKGDQAPLGSGINLPPQEQKEPIAAAKVATPKPAKPSPKPTPKSEPVAPAAAEGGSFVVQVASFRTSEDAGKLAARLKGYKLTAYIEKADLGEKGVWHRVLSGPYANRENADKAADLLREKERLSALVRQK